MARTPPVIQFTRDLAMLAGKHPQWFLRQSGRSLLEMRAQGNSTYRYGLPQVHHHRLDERLSGLEIALGGATHVSLAKATIVSRFCKLLQPTRVLEIGTFRGGMTYHIARNSPPDCRIYTLDLPRQEVARVEQGMVASDVDLAEIDDALVGDQWRGTPMADKITQLWGDSMSFDFSPFAPFDLVYIDGSHAEAWVARDTENAFAHLAATGAVLWDDCYWSGVLNVLGRWTAERPIHLFEDGSTAGYLQIDGKAVAVETS